MPKVYLDEINAVLNSSTCSVLTTDSTESKKTGDALQTYIDSSGILKGEQWDKSRTKMGLYSDALKARMELASKMAEAINKALTLLRDYLGEDAYLDTEQLPEFQKQKQICEQSIATLTEMLSATTTVSRTGSDGKVYYETVKMYDTAAVQAQIDEANKILAELNRLITKIEGLEAVYNQAMAILEEGFAGLSAFQTSVGSIKPSGIYTYKPAA